MRNIFLFFLLFYVTASAAYLNFVKSGTSFSPDSVSGMTAWFKADAITGKVDNDTISTWDDSGPVGTNDLTTAGATPPIYKTNIVNGKPVVRFNGVGTTWLKTTVNASSIITVSASSVWAVVRVTSIVGAQTGASYFTNDTIWRDVGGYTSFSYHSGGPNVTYYNYDTNADVPETSVALNTWKVIHGRHASGTLYVSTNNGSETSTASGNTGSLASAMYVGGSAATSITITGDIAELLFYNVVVGSDDRTSIQTYLNDKYAVY